MDLASLRIFKSVVVLSRYHALYPDVQIELVTGKRRLRGRWLRHRGRAARCPAANACGRQSDDDPPSSQNSKVADATGLAPGPSLDHARGDEESVRRQSEVMR